MVTQRSLGHLLPAGLPLQLISNQAAAAAALSLASQAYLSGWLLALPLLPEVSNHPLSDDSPLLPCEGRGVEMRWQSALLCCFIRATPGKLQRNGLMAASGSVLHKPVDDDIANRLRGKGYLSECTENA